MTSSSSATSVDEDRRRQIKEIVCEILEIDPEDVTATSLFKEDHGADSLGAIEILARLERTFNVTIDQADLGQMVNLEGVQSVVDKAPAN